MRELVLGCGPRPRKIISAEGAPKEFVNPTLLDVDPHVGADVVHDLNTLPYPFGDGTFDEVHAYNVLEHTGRQGDWRFFFAQFNELARVTHVGGILCAAVPSLASVWLWGDPGHTRAITREQLMFLDRDVYGTGRLQSDGYLPYLTRSWRLDHADDDGKHLVFVLRRMD